MVWLHLVGTKNLDLTSFQYLISSLNFLSDKPLATCYTIPMLNCKTYQGIIVLMAIFTYNQIEPSSIHWYLFSFHCMAFVKSVPRLFKKKKFWTGHSLLFSLLQLTFLGTVIKIFSIREACVCVCVSPSLDVLPSCCFYQFAGGSLASELVDSSKEPGADWTCWKMWGCTMVLLWPGFCCGCSPWPRSAVPRFGCRMVLSPASEGLCWISRDVRRG